MQLFIDRVEQRYSVAMVAATIGFLVVPLLIGAWSFKEALIRAMTFMIVASPCAVVLATMPPLLSAIANAGRHGVLMKSAVALEQLAVVDGVAFDKTGTITRGRPSVSFVTVAPGSSFDRDTVLTLAASAEHPSEHPIGVAIVSAAAERGLQVPAATSFHSLAGRGVEAVVGDHLVEVASPAYALERSRGSSWCEAATRAAHQEGHTVVTVIVDHLQVALIGLDDVVRDDAAEAVAQLEALIGAPALLLTGDNEIVARRVADHVGISHVEADLLPEDKVEQIRRRQDAGRSLLVVGDGVNDAPVLATARFGMAMGQMGADITLQAADGVILRDQLLTLPALLRLARRARRMVYVNLTFAVTVIIVLVTLDISGHLPLPLGVAGHEGSTVVIGLNGLRLLGRRAWRVDVAESAKRIGEPEALEELGKRELTFPAT
jgi:heavy metal translocating P-type ATPase